MHVQDTIISQDDCILDIFLHIIAIESGWRQLLQAENRHSSRVRFCQYADKLWTRQLIHARTKKKAPKALIVLLRKKKRRYRHTDCQRTGIGSVVFSGLPGRNKFDWSVVCNQRLKMVGISSDIYCYKLTNRRFFFIEIPLEQTHTHKKSPIQFPFKSNIAMGLLSVLVPAIQYELQP